MHILLLTVAGLLAAAEPADVKMLSGREMHGTVVSLDGQKLVLRSDGGEESLPTQELLSVTFQRADSPNATPPKRILLNDGSSVVVTEFQTDKGGGKFTLSDGTTINVPAATIRAARLGPLDDAGALQFQQLTEKGPAADLIVVKKKDSAAASFLEGVVGDISAETVQFQLDGDPIAVKRDRVLGVIYYRKAAADLGAAACSVTDQHGSRLLVKSLTVADNLASLTTMGGVELPLPVTQLRALDFSAGKIVYLSDLEPLLFRWTPYLGFANPPESLASFYALQRDVGHAGQPLSLGGITYAKGVSLTSRSEVKYRLPAGMKKFQATVGIDDAYTEQGNVLLSIVGDGRPLHSGNVHGEGAPLELDLPVNGVKELTILVDFGEGMDIGDHVNLCNARVTQ